MRRLELFAKSTTRLGLGMLAREEFSAMVTPGSILSCS
jgi:hypothetical protein